MWMVATQDVTLLDPQKITEKTASFPLRGVRQNITENHRTPARREEFVQGNVGWQGGLKGEIPLDNKYEKSSRQMGRAQRQRWQNGEEPFDARIDLHGLTQLAAHKRLVDFILSAHQNGNRSLLVITGKGRGIIRGAIGHWLEAPLLAGKILDFVQAQPKDGGEGALYILLRKAQHSRVTKKLS
ncbi:MAG: Smr/MutS family protein [Pseudobdellovibrionaceae bacterium]